MSRIRTIKPEFPQSESIGKISREARLLFLQLFTIVDDAGRARGAPRMLASLLYPYDDDAPALVERWLVELAREGLVRRYQTDGAQYLWLPSWTIHQKIDRATPSRLPAPDDDAAIRDECASVAQENATPLVPEATREPVADTCVREESLRVHATSAREDRSSPREASRGCNEGSRGLATDLGPVSGPGPGSRSRSEPEPGSRLANSGSGPPAQSGPSSPHANANSCAGASPSGSSSAGSNGSDFETFWRAYPRRDGPNPRSPAERKFHALIASGVDPAMLIAAVKRLRAEQSAKNNLGSRFVPQAMTWLTQERWADHAEVAPDDAQSTEMPIEDAVRLFARTRCWSKWAGPEPGLTGCRATPELFAQYGLMPDGRPDPSPEGLAARAQLSGSHIIASQTHGPPAATPRDASSQVMPPQVMPSQMLPSQTHAPPSLRAMPRGS